MSRDPVVAPVIILTPGVGVQVECGEIQSRDVQKGNKVSSLTVRVRIRSIAGKTEPFDTSGDQVVGVEALDVLGRGLCPVVDDARVAAVAAGLVAELPGQDGGRVDKARDDGLDVGLVLGLRGGVGVPRRLAAAERVDVGLDAAVVVPLVDKGDHQLDAPGLGGRDDVVEALQAVGARVDGGAAGGQVLEVDGAVGGDRVDVVEAPDAQDL